MASFMFPRKYSIHHGIAQYVFRIKLIPHSVESSYRILLSYHLSCILSSHSIHLQFGPMWSTPIFLQQLTFHEVCICIKAAHRTGQHFKLCVTLARCFAAEYNGHYPSGYPASGTHLLLCLDIIPLTVHGFIIPGCQFACLVFRLHGLRNDERHIGKGILAK